MFFVCAAIVGLSAFIATTTVTVVFSVKLWLRLSNQSAYQHPRNGPFVTLYHYTTKSGAESILKSGRVKPSRSKGDAAFGEGVYMTSLNPRDHRMVKVAENNYDSAWDQNRDKTQAAIEIRIPEKSVKQVDSDRDIWLYTEGDLLLDRYCTNNLFVGKADGDYSPNKWSL